MDFRAVASKIFHHNVDLDRSTTLKMDAAGCHDAGTACQSACAPTSPCSNAIDETIKLATNRIASLKALAPTGEPWTGWRPFDIVNRIEEAEHQVTFELKPSDGLPIPGYKAGQFLTIGLDINGERETRCYSLSDSPQADVFRITIKRVLGRSDTAPPGKVSNYVHDQLQVGTKIDVKAPAGEFVFDMAKTTPAVFLAGGVGVTPFLSMLKLIADTGSQRQVHLFYAVNQTSELVRPDELRALAANHPNIKVHFIIAKPQGEARSDQPRFITMDLLKSQLPKGNYDFFMCGPPPMMAALTEAFQKAGVSHRNIFTESFGAAAAPSKLTPAEKARGVNDVGAEVHFVGVGQTLHFSPDKGSLLEQGLAEGIALNSMCRSGSCKGCQCELVSGKVEYPLGDPGVPAGKVLPCVAVPLPGETVVINEKIARS